ncbi:CRASP family complement regulator-acquiring lipoprotein [Borrelia persica]|uniref:CRASP family complement regulator-acquiring lipoprotein n=1 Tax=Borrelia persica TaxID=44448 RepID=UPI0004641E56|nr:CRASP family complement regulator-acquiring lipoprotein [Borrelia persica]
MKAIASSAEIDRVFAVHDVPDYVEPADQYGMGLFFCLAQYYDKVHPSGTILYRYYDRSSFARRLIYLAFGYDPDNFAFFSVLFKNIKKFAPSDYVSIVYGILNELAKFSEKYYLSSFRTLRDKKDYLVFLKLAELRTLQQQFVLLESGKTKLLEMKNQIKADYANDIGGIRTTSCDIKIGRAVYNYLTDVNRNYKKRLKDAVVQVDKADIEIIKILNKI